MIAHFVAFEWVEGTSQAQIDAVTEALFDMARRVPELRYYMCGANLRLRPSTADFGVLALVDDAEGLTAYLDSTAHAEVQKRWLGDMIADRTAVQLDIANATFTSD